jgi:hypothetical protein
MHRGVRGVGGDASKRAEVSDDVPTDELVARLQAERDDLRNEVARLRTRVAHTPAGVASDLAAILNRMSRENASNTPDFLLADFMLGCLDVYERTLQQRERWLGEGAALPTTG